MATHSARRSGFTLIELLVVIAIIAILASILFPVFAQAREAARKASCTSNLKQQGIGITMYAQDFDETLPQGSRTMSDGTVWRWMHQTFPYVKNAEVYHCPSSTFYWDASVFTGNAGSYGYNAYFLNNGALGAIPKPAETVVVVDTPGGTVTGNRFRSRPDLPDGSAGAVWNGWAQTESRVAYLHQGGANVLFADGHVKTQRPGDLNQIAATEDGAALTGEDRYVLWNLH